MQPQTNRISLKHPSFDLDFKLSNDCLNIKLFHHLEQVHYIVNVPYNDLPLMANAVFHNVSQIIVYLQDINKMAVRGDFSKIEFRDNMVILRDFICRGQKQIQIPFELKKASLDQNIQLLKERIKEEQKQLQQLNNLCNFQYQQEIKNKKAEKFVGTTYTQICKKENDLRKLKQSNLRKISQQEQQIQQKNAYLKYLKNLENDLNEQSGTQMSEQVQPVSFPFELTEGTQYIEIGHWSKCLKSVCWKKPLLIRSTNAFPLNGSWTVAFKPQNVDSSFVFGIIQESTQFQLLGIESPLCIALCPYQKTIYIKGLRYILPYEPDHHTENTFKLTLNRQTHIVNFIHNFDTIHETAISEKMRKGRLYPFIQISGGHIVEIETLKMLLQ